MILLLVLFLLLFPALAAAAVRDDRAEQARISAEAFEYKVLDHFYSAE